jgi:hypothetical protein
VTSHRGGRKRDEEARLRIRAVLATPDGAGASHEHVAELAKCNKNMVRQVRRDLALTGYPQKRKSPTPRPKATKPAPAPVALPLDPQQAELLTRIYDVALGGTNTLRLLEIRGLLKTQVGQRLREAAVIATGKAGAA